MAADLTAIKASLEDLSDDELERLIAATSNKPRRSGAVLARNGLLLAASETERRDRPAAMLALKLVYQFGRRRSSNPLASNNNTIAPNASLDRVGIAEASMGSRR